MKLIAASLLAAGALGAAAFAVGMAFSPAARSQIQVTAYVPIGVAASGNSSTAWFHEPSSRRAVACQTVTQGSAISSINCTSVSLP